MKVLNFGSLNIDYVYSVDHFVQKGETLASNALNIYTGGKGLNQSVALGRAGVKTYHAGAIGEDGQFLLDFLKKAGVDTTYVSKTDEIRTGNAIIQTDKTGDNCILLFGGANQAISKHQVDATLSCFDEGDFIVLQNEINEMPYIIQKAHEKGMIIVLNPAPMNKKVSEMPLQLVDYLVVNEIEAAQLLERTFSEEEDVVIADALVEKFPNTKIILTLGEKGSIYIEGKKRIIQEIYKTKVVDTTAAGDCFIGYFVAAIMQKKSVEEAMNLAAKASAIAVSKAGAAPSIPMMEEVLNH